MDLVNAPHVPPATVAADLPCSDTETADAPVLTAESTGTPTAFPSKAATRYREVTLVEEFDVDALRGVLASPGFAAEEAKRQANLDAYLARRRSDPSAVLDKRRLPMRAGLEQYLGAASRTEPGGGVGGGVGKMGVGRVQVRYSVPPGRLGRHVARSVGAGPANYCYGMNGRVRSHLARRLYHDLDMVNAAPTISLQIMQAAGLEAPFLEEYVRHRAFYLAQVMDDCGVDRQVAKSVFIVLAFGGTVPAWCNDHGVLYDTVPDFVLRFAEELGSTMKAVLQRTELGRACTEQQRAKKEAGGLGCHNLVGSAFAVLYQDTERRCLSALYSAVLDSGRTVGAFIFDGLLVRRTGMEQGMERDMEDTQDMEGPLPKLHARDLKAWEEAIYTDTGFRVELAEKDMDLDPEYAAAAGVLAPPDAPLVLTALQRRLFDLELVDELTPLNATDGFTMADWPAPAALKRAICDLAKIPDDGEVLEAALHGLGDDDPGLLWLSMLVGERVLSFQRSTLNVKVDGVSVGYLPARAPNGKGLYNMDSRLVPAMRWTVDRPAADHVSCCSPGPPVAAGIGIFDFDTPDDAFARLTVNNVTQKRNVVGKRAMKQLYTAYDAAVRNELRLRGLTEIFDLAMASGAVTININQVNNNLVNSTLIGGSIIRQSVEGNREPSSDFDALRMLLVEDACRHGYKRLGGHVYRPVQGSPCAFETHLPYSQHLNAVLQSHPAFQGNMRCFADLTKWIINIDHPNMPFMVRDRNLVSFPNGVLVLSERRFVPNASLHMEAWGPRGSGACARHHIPSDFTGSTSTPMFDSLVSAQFPAARQAREADAEDGGDEDGSDGDGSDDEPLGSMGSGSQEYSPTAKALHILLGRLLFPIGTHDNWEVLPLLVGLGGTGKSTVAKVLEHMFDPSSVGEISENLEAVFGLEALRNKEIILARDVPQEVRKILNQELMQKMVSGERLSVPGKNVTAVTQTWDVPMLWCSNHILDYKDSGGNITRRIVPFRFRNVVKSKNTQLYKLIISTELPNLLWKFLNAYLDAVHTNGDRDFWSLCPAAIREDGEELLTETNYLQRFLTVTAEEYAGQRVAFKEGSHVLYKTFEALYRDYMLACNSGVSTKLDKIDTAPLQRMGCVVKKAHLCKICNNICRAKTCGDHYDDKQRGQFVVVMNLETVETPAPTPFRMAPW
jgi:hypothetical protein